MGFADAFSGMSAALMKTYGKPAAYIPNGGFAVNITARIAYETEDQQSDSATKDKAKITVLASQVTAPAYHDQVMVDGETWLVKQWKKAESEWELSAIKDTRALMKKEARSILR